MLTNLAPQNALFLTNLNRLENQIAQSNQEISSGLRITVASDAPDQIGTLLQLRANQQHNSQIQSNLTLAKMDARAADDSLTSSIQLVETATTLATQGATATADANARASLAQQVASILQQMISNSQTSVEGRFIFSGDQDGAPQYTWDATQPNPVVAAADASASTRLVEDPAGGTFNASLTARQIFDNRDSAGDPAADNVFGALQTLQAALTADDTGRITNSIALLQ